jgi:hypothetical protein
MPPGTYKAPWHGTVPELIGSYLKSATFEKEANTKVSYRDARPTTGRPKRFPSLRGWVRCRS